MKKLILLLVVLTLDSCYHFKENGIDFKIINSSKSEITNVKFYTSEQLRMAEYTIISADKSVSDFLSMKHNQSDGDYILEFTRKNGQKETHNHGYYTNGGSHNSWIRFEIKTDTTLVQFSDY